MENSFDAIVIGGGSGGLAFAKEAAQRGASILLIERARLGGTCVNRGCVPKKMMWAVADTMQTQAEMASQGIIDKPSLVNFAKLADIRASRIDDIVDSFDQDLEDAGIRQVNGEAVLASNTEVKVGETTYTSDKIVIATGGRPSRLDIPGGDLMDQSDGVFEWRTLPKRLVVVGPGYIGCEMAAIFNALGSEVTLVSNSDAVLTEFSKSSQQIAGKNLKRSGVDIRYNTEPLKVTTSEAGLMIALADGTEVHADRVLNATGRDPNLQVFGEIDVPAQAGNGSLEIDDHFATSMAGVYAIGDTANRLPLTPVAREDGTTLAKQLFGAPETPQIDLDLVATTAFVFPPIGEVGETKTVEKIETFTAMESLIAGGKLDEGWALQRNPDGGLSGVCLIGHAAAESISWAAQLVPTSRTRKQMNDATSVHPSKAEELLGSDE